MVVISVAEVYGSDVGIYLLKDIFTSWRGEPKFLKNFIGLMTPYNVEESK